MRIEQLIGAEPQIRQDPIDGGDAGGFQDVFQLGEIGVEQPDLAWGVFQAGLGVLQVARIDVEADQQAVGGQSLGDLAGVPGPAEGAVDDCLAGLEVEAFKDFIEQDGVVAEGAG